MDAAHARGPRRLPRLVRWLASRDHPVRSSSSAAVRALWAVRLKAGQVFGWDLPEAGVGSRVPTLRDLLPPDLRGVSPGPEFGVSTRTPLYLLDDEFATEIANRTMHGVLHVGWVPDKSGRHEGQLAVLVKPNGLLGTCYMAAIRPFRHLIVYPIATRDIERARSRLNAGQGASGGPQVAGPSPSAER